MDNTPAVKLFGFLVRQELTTARDEVGEKCGLGLRAEQSEEFAP